MQSFRFANPRRLVVSVFLALAAGCAVASVLVAYAGLQDKASRQLALRQGPPPAITVDAFRPLLHGGPAGEIVLRAEADLDAPILFTLPGTSDRAIVVPLLAPEGDGAVHGAILVRLEGDALPPAEVLAARLPEGAVEVSGFAEDPGPYLFMLAGALAAEDRALGPRFVAVRPFIEGREAALAPVVPPSPAWARFALASAGFLVAAVAAYLGPRWADALVRPRRRVPPPRPVLSGHFPPLHLPDGDPGGPGQSVLRALSRAGALGAVGWRIAVATAIVVLRWVAGRIPEFRSPR